MILERSWSGMIEEVTGWHMLEKMDGRREKLVDGRSIISRNDIPIIYKIEEIIEHKKGSLEGELVSSR